MNRIFKFRAWTGDKMRRCSVAENGLAMMDFGPTKAPLMQFTGLKDKNGVEIYEGDIVEWDDGSNGKWRRRCEVRYVPAHFQFVGYYYDVDEPEIHTPITFECGSFAYEENSDEELTVIGNIHENGDLLK